MATLKKRSIREGLASRHLYDDTVGKLLEQSIVEKFLMRLAVRQYRLQPQERPDFVISLGHGEVSIGCEVTLYDSETHSSKKRLGSAERRFHTQWKRFAKKLRERLDQEGGSFLYLYGTLHFKKSNYDVLDGVNWIDLIEEIISFIKSGNKDAKSHMIDKQSYPLLASLVNHLNFGNYFPETGLLWWCSHLQSGTVKPPTPALIRIVRSKNAKAAEYAWGSVQEKWLLIYARASGLTDVAVLREDPEVSRKIINISFTQIFLWDQFSESIHELYPEFRIVLEEARNLYVKRIPHAVRPFLVH